jgi:murein DD-endopeptidase MepM/ murein hydrolase activator NlpD
MNLIFIWKRRGEARQLDFAHPLTLGVLGALVLGIFATAFLIGMRLGQGSGAAFAGDPDNWARTIAEQKAQIADLRSQVQDRVDAMAVRLGQLNAHVLRIDALGKRLTEMADIDHREFNFDREPAIGGPEDEAGSAAAQIPDITTMFDEIEKRLDLRSAQLAALENLIIARNLNDEIRPEGRPVRDGYISSYFGERQDPFTGHDALHKGLDFAGEAGSEVLAVGAGIVTWSGLQDGYGWLVEVTHGNGLVTRYAHNARNLVNVGDTVSRGQPLAVMGSTGRSTGPHVHFEVLRNGRQVDPLAYVGR